MTCVAIIQARLSSTRFPNKVLSALGGMPMILFMLERVRRSRLVDTVIVATSDDPSDDVLAAALAGADAPFVRGNLDDVLARFGLAARETGATEIVRLTGDCPLIDPEVVDTVIALRREAGADYASNIDPPTYPDGLDVEVCTRAALDRALAEAASGPEREHVTLWMRDEAASLSRVNHRNIVDCAHIRLTVDYPDDLTAVRALLAGLGKGGAQADLPDMLRVLARDRNILGLNPHARNEGLAISMAAHERT